MPRIIRMSVSIAAVATAYWVYGLVAVPWIEPAAGERYDDKSIVAKDPIDRLAPYQDLFAANAWELDKTTKILESDQVKLLWGDLSDDGDGTMLLQPCTILFTPNGGSTVEADRGRDAIVLEARQGARLKFSQPLDLRRGSFGRLEKGQLIGPIKIRGNGRSPGPEDDLLVTARDVFLTEQRLWTPEQISDDPEPASDVQGSSRRLRPNWIDFRMGANVGRGTGFEINFLRGNDAGSARSHGLNIGGIRSMELLHLEFLRLQLTRSGFQTGPSAPDRAAPAVQDEKAAVIPIEITCRGRFIFDMLQQTATFHDQVNLWAHPSQGESDHIAGEMLSVVFAKKRPPTPTSGAGEPVAAKAKSMDPGLSDLQPVRIEAIGYPVVVYAPSQQAQARGRKLVYDLALRRILLEDPQEAFLRHGPPEQTSEIHAPYIWYQDGGEGRLGQAEAKGPGWLRAFLKDRPTQPFEARWNGRLTLGPYEEQHLISLTGGTRLSYGVLGDLTAPEVYFWLTQVPAADRSQRSGVRPDRMMAGHKDGPQGRDVFLNSAQLSGKFGQLEVWFEQAAEGSAPLAPSRPLAQFDRSLRTMEKAADLANRVPATLQKVWRPIADAGRSVGIPMGGEDDAMARTADPARAPLAGVVLPETRASIGQHFDAAGDLLQAQVEMMGEQGELSQLTLSGNVQLDETQTDRPGEKPVRIVGERIQMSNVSRPYAAANIVGSPAHFEGRGLGLTGPNINLNRGTNRLWTEGPGQMELFIPRDLQGRPLPSGMILTVQWKERMTLVDGNAIEFVGAVDAMTQPDRRQRLQTETLKATFQQPIRFDDPRKQPEPKVQEIACSGGVVLESREFDEQGQASFERIEVPDLTMNALTGELFGASPANVGTRKVVLVRRGPPPTLSGAAGEQLAPRQNRPDSSKELTYVGIRFEGPISGNQQENKITLHDGVKAVFGPVENWDTELPFRPEAMNTQGALLRCNELSVAQLATVVNSQRSFLMEAKGNTVVEGKTAEGRNFTARALRISFDQSKGQLILDGDGWVDASLYLQERLGDQPKEHRARTIQFWPQTGRYHEFRTRTLDLSG